ncbi:MAG: hypothetical protein Q4E62_02035 [Sutterellaceae bacterium]|nr:hypothetical protein [Sutterellaceae bacterium]
MSTTVINATVGPNGEVEIPTFVRKILNVGEGDCVSFFVENGVVRLMKSEECAKQFVRRYIRADATRNGTPISDEEIDELIEQIGKENTDH